MSHDGVSKQQNPLIPMSDIFSPPSTSLCNKDIQKQIKSPIAQSDPAPSSVLDMIDREVENLKKIQSDNNEEIKKRLTDIQSLRENNLVVVGALGGLKKLKESLKV